MKNNVIKIAIAFFLSFILSVVGFYIFITNQIETPKIKKLITESIATNLKGANVTIEALEYEIGRKINFEIKNLKIASNNKEDLIVESINVKVPLYSIITSGGVVEINVFDPKIFYLDNDKTLSNWESFFTSGVPNAKTKTLKVTVPKFLEKSKINLKIRRAVIKGPKNEFVISKIIFKNLNRNKSTAFEITGSGTQTLFENELKFDYLGIGEIHLKDILDNQVSKSNIMLKLSNLKIANKEMPSLKLSGIIEFKRDSALKVNFRNEMDSILRGEFKGALSASNLSLEALEQEIIPNEFFSTFDILSKSLLERIDFGEGILKTNGVLNYNFNTKKLKSFLRVISTKDMTFDILSKKVTSNIELNNQDSNIEINLLLKGFDGNGAIKYKTTINDQFDGVKSTSIAMNLENMKVDVPNYSLRSEEVNSESNEAVEGNEEANFQFPDFSLDVKTQSLLLNNIPVSLELSSKAVGNVLQLKGAKFEIAEKSNINLKGTYSLSRDQLLLISGDINNVDMSTAKSLFPDELQNLEGSLTGTFNLRNLLSEPSSTSLSSKITLENGSINNVDLNSLLKPILRNLDGNDAISDDLNSFLKFKKLNSHFEYSDNNFKLDSVELISTNKKKLIEAQGNISLEERKNSSLELKVFSLPRNNMDYLPVLLKGDGLNIIPDIEYTKGKLSMSKLIKSKKIN